jgi:hypothetical protein
VSQQDGRCNLPYISALAAHIRSSDDLKVRLTWNHLAVITDAARGVLDLNQRMPTLHQLKDLVLVDSRPHILVVTRHLGEGTQDIELGYQGGNLLKQGVISRSDFQYLLD